VGYFVLKLAQNIPIVVYPVPLDDEHISAVNMYRLLVVIN
jgi:hypothetical protein